MKKKALVVIICLSICAMFLQMLPSGVSATENPTAVGLTEFAIKAYSDGWGYVYGTYGQMITQATIDGKAQQYPNNFDGILSDGRTVYQVAQKWIGHRGADCVGLMKAYLWWRGDAYSPSYNSAQDRSANGTYNAATVKGPISTIPETHGICLWKEGHVGIYIGNGWVIEARGTEYGVVLTRLSDRGWAAWFKNPYVSYSANGWTTIAGQTYFYRDGCYLTGVQVIDGKTYNLGTDGVLTAGFALVSGQLRYFQADGQLLTGWQTIDGERYYLGADNVAKTGWTEIDGQMYLFGEAGNLLTGWQQTDEGIYYLNEQGNTQTGSLEIGSRTFLFGESGQLLTGWQTAGENRSYLDLAGQALTGLQMIGGQLYLFDETGKLLTGWQTAGSSTYYFDSESGAGATSGLQTIAEQALLFADSGKLIETPGLVFAGGQVYLGLDGGLPADGSQDLTGYTDAAEPVPVSLLFSAESALEPQSSPDFAIAEPVTGQNSITAILSSENQIAGQLAVSGILPEGTATWLSLDPDVATVDAAGQVTGTGIGRTLIILRAANGEYAVCQATILPDPGTMTAPAIELEAGRSVQLSMDGLPDNLLTACSFVSSAPGVATIDATGTITAEANGQANITITGAGQTLAVISVTVGEPLIGLAAEYSARTLPVGARSDSFAALVREGNDSTITYASSNATIASVSAAGVIKGLTLGTAVITATAGEFTASCTITVNGNYPTLRRGSSGQAVRNLQQRLSDLGYITGSVDGSYGPMTEFAVLCFQKNLGLTMTGNADHALQIALQADSAPAAAAIQTPGILQPGDSGEAVLVFQQRLFDLNYLKENPTGTFNALTLMAMRTLQNVNGITQSDVADNATIGGLLSRKIIAGKTSLIIDNSGYEVLNLQVRLQELGYYPGVLNGYFNAEVEKGVQAFQYMADLTIDGIAGAKTQKALFASTAPACIPEALVAVTMTTLKSGQSSEAVIVLENRLIALGYHLAVADTVYDSLTASSVSAFQQRSGLSQTGIADIRTQARMVLETAKTSLSAYAYGSSGDAVRLIQARLNQLGYACGTADGSFGSKTRTAVYAFQRQAGLVVDGQVAQTTIARLFAADAPKSPVIVTLKKGSQSEDVTRLEERLVALGYHYALANSTYDNLTVSAIKAFQKRAKLKQTGIADSTDRKSVV